MLIEFSKNSIEKVEKECWLMMKVLSGSDDSNG
jgi:hypothetical protein